MVHAPVKAHIPVAMQKRIATLPTANRYGITVLDDFAVFIDTHRDQPHIGTFNDDIHRGHYAPTLVSYAVEDDLLVNSETGKLLVRHDKHLFVTAEFWASFVLDYVVKNGESPLGGDGTMVTSHLRDPRAGRYMLRSFRQIIDYWVSKNP